MAIYVANITIPGGADFNQTFFLENINNNIKVRLDSTSKNPLNLTGYTGYAKLKKSSASLKTSATFAVSFPNLTNGSIRLSLGSTETAALKPGRYCYDVLINSGSTKTRVFEGNALVTAGITTI